MRTVPTNARQICDDQEMRPSGLLDEEFAGDNWDLGALDADLLAAADAAVEMQALQGRGDRGGRLTAQ